MKQGAGCHFLPDSHIVSASPLRVGPDSSDSVARPTRGRPEQTGKAELSPSASLTLWTGMGKARRSLHVEYREENMERNRMLIAGRRSAWSSC